MHEVVLEGGGVTVARDDDEKLVPKTPPAVELELPQTEYGGLPVGPKVEVVFPIA